jgi:hypothetical protein
LQGVDPEGLLSAALFRSGGGGGDPQLLASQLPLQLQGMEALAASQLEDALKGEGSGDLHDRGDSTDDEQGSVGAMGNGGGGATVPPRTGSICDRKCTKVRAWLLPVKSANNAGVQREVVMPMLW